MSAANILAQHRKLWSDSIASCSGCDWTKFGNLTRTDLAHAAHQLDALKAAGYAVVETAKPGSADGNFDAWGTTSPLSVRRFADDDPRRIYLWDSAHPCDHGADPINAAQSRELAAALLAAADAAEVQS